MSECGLCSQGLPMSGGGKRKSPIEKKTAKSKAERKHNRKTCGGSNANAAVTAPLLKSIKAEIKGGSGNMHLDVFLAKDQTLIADKHAMLFMDGDIQFVTEMKKGAIGRMLSGETAFMSKYTGTSDSKLQRLCLGVGMPGDIIKIDINVGESWKLSRGAFLAGTHDLLVTGKSNMIGLLGVGQDEGAVLSYVKAKTFPGTFWVASYGYIERHELKDGDTMLVDNEHFLACPGNVSYSIQRLGNMKSLLFGGEGFAMKFSGPCTIYTQSKGIRGLVKMIEPYIVRH